MSYNPNFKNVVSVQGLGQNVSAGAAATYASGVTLGVSGTSGASTIIKHSVFILQGSSTNCTVLPVYYNVTGAGITGPTLGVQAANVPVQINARLKSFTGLTLGTISFLA